MRVMTDWKPARADIARLVREYQISSLIFSTVRSNARSFASYFPSGLPRLMLTPDLRLNFENRYASPLTLGTDRIANVAGARRLFPGKTVLVVSAGTCITYDLLHAEGIYFGGSISPGIAMRLQAEHRFTGRLPRVEPKDAGSLFGTDTASAMQTGAVNGARFELQGYVAATRQWHDKFIVLLTGGDAAMLQGKMTECMGCRIFVRPHLSLIGLNELATLNEAAFTT